MHTLGYRSRVSVIMAAAASLFTLASAHADLTLTGDTRFMSAEFRLDRPDGSSGGGPFTVTPAFGRDQFGSSATPGDFRNGNQVYVSPNFQESSFRSDRIVARGTFGATSNTAPGYSGMARVVNRVDYRFSVEEGEQWTIQGTTSGNGFFQLFDPSGNLLIANSGMQMGWSVPGSYRLLAGDDGVGNSSATSSGGSDTYEGTFDVTITVPTPGAAAVGAMGLIAVGGRRRRA
jgi:hypothetical protein